MADQRVDGPRAASSPALRTIEPRRLPMRAPPRRCPVWQPHRGACAVPARPPWRSRSGFRKTSSCGRHADVGRPHPLPFAREVELAGGLLEPLRHSARPWRHQSKRCRRCVPGDPSHAPVSQPGHLERTGARTIVRAGRLGEAYYERWHAVSRSGGGRRTAALFCPWQYMARLGLRSTLATSAARTSWAFAIFPVSVEHEDSYKPTDAW